MMAAPEPPSLKSHTGSPDLPRNPNRKYVPFEMPKPRCSVPGCPSFCTPVCGLCKLHCEKIHNGKHTITSDVELHDLINKYLNRGEK